MAKRQASLFDFCPRALKKQRECQSEEKTDESDNSTFQEEDSQELLEVSFAKSWTFLKYIAGASGDHKLRLLFLILRCKNLEAVQYP